jgi:hypothetical protein
VDAPVASLVAAPVNAVAPVAPIAVRRISSKLRNVKRGPAFRKMNNAFTQLRSTRATRASHAPRVSPRAPTHARARATMTQNSRRVIMGGSHTRRAKGSQRSRRSQCKD